MSIIQIASNSCANWLANKVPNTEYETVEDQISVYSYGFQVILGALVKGALLVSISYLLGVLVPALIITLTFSSFRVIAGGYHMKTYSRCISFSLFQFILAALIAKYTFYNWTNINLFILVIATILLGVYTIIRYIPRDNPNKPINKQEDIKKFKNWSGLYYIIWSIMMLTCIVTGIKIVVITSSFGLLLELFSITNLGHKTYKIFDYKQTNITQ